MTPMTRLLYKTEQERIKIVKIANKNFFINPFLSITNNNNQDISTLKREELEGFVIYEHDLYFDYTSFAE